MKTLSTCLLITLVSWLPTAVWSQPAAREEPLPMEVHVPFDAPDRGPDFDTPPPGRSGDPMHHGPRMGRGDGPGGAEHLERWLDHLRRNSPEEFERLMEMRENDPKAFHKALRKRRDQLRDRAATDPFHDMPRMRRFMEDLPPEERERVMDRFSGERSPRRPDDDPEIAGLYRETKALAKRYHETPEEGQEAVRAELREHLEEVFTQRAEQQRRRISQMEKKMDGLRRMLDTRAEHREEIITRRMQDLLGEDPLAW